MRKFLLQLLLCILLFTALFFNLFVSKIDDTTYVLVYLAVFLGLSIAINGWRRNKNRGTDDALMIIVGMSIILLTLFYMVGLKSGFNISYTSVFKNYLDKWVWLRVILIVILTEFARYVVASMDIRDNKKRWLLDGVIFLCFFLVDISISTKVYDYTNFNQLYDFFALVFVQSIAKNIFLTYISHKYGYSPTIAYRFLIDLYAYFIPIVPALNMFIQSVIMLIFPYVVHVVIKKLEGEVEKKQKRVKKINKIIDRFITAVTTIIFAVLVVLVSREFTYCMIAIGSESMTGTFNKGDAIVYKKYDKDKDELVEGDIIVFVKNSTTIVHRINKTFTSDGVKMFQTKGDFNDSPDNWIVEQNEIVGMVKTKVVYIGWPSVWLSELF